jgi:hypothetical protein
LIPVLDGRVRREPGEERGDVELRLEARTPGRRVGAARLEGVEDRAHVAVVGLRLVVLLLERSLIPHGERRAGALGFVHVPRLAPEATLEERAVLRELDARVEPEVPEPLAVVEVEPVVGRERLGEAGAAHHMVRELLVQHGRIGRAVRK